MNKINYVMILLSLSAMQSLQADFGNWIRNIGHNRYYDDNYYRRVDGYRPGYGRVTYRTYVPVVERRTLIEQDALQPVTKKEEREEAFQKGYEAAEEKNRALRQVTGQ